MKILILVLVICNHQLYGTPVKRPLAERIVEGDIKIDVSKSLGNSGNYNKWSGGVVPYIIDNAKEYTYQQVFMIRKAMGLITSKTDGCITFVPRTNAHTSWLRIKSSDGCWSYVGKKSNQGEQELSLSKSGCMYKGTIVHELCHALGFYHEQNRADRDNYVRINYENIIEGMDDQFKKYSKGLYFSTPYDYGSIMHYSKYAFSKNGLETITPLQAGVVLVPAYDKTDAQILTAYDVQAIRIRYECSSPTQASTTVSTTTTTSTTTKIPTSTTSIPCINANPTCEIYLSKKDTYCDPAVNYYLGHSKFRNACNKMCGVCRAPADPCSDQWFCKHYSSTYCSALGAIYIVNGLNFVEACPKKCNYNKFC